MFLNHLIIYLSNYSLHASAYIQTRTQTVVTIIDGGGPDIAANLSALVSVRLSAPYSLFAVANATTRIEFVQSFFAQLRTLLNVSSAVDRFAVESFVDRAPDGTQFTFVIAQSLSADANGTAIVAEASAGALAALFMRLVGDSKSALYDAAAATHWIDIRFMPVVVSAPPVPLPTLAPTAAPSTSPTVDPSPSSPSPTVDPNEHASAADSWSFWLVQNIWLIGGTAVGCVATALLCRLAYRSREKLMRVYDLFGEGEGICVFDLAFLVWLAPHFFGNYFLILSISPFSPDSDVVAVLNNSCLFSCIVRSLPSLSSFSCCGSTSGGEHSRLGAEDLDERGHSVPPPPPPPSTIQVRVPAGCGSAEGSCEGSHGTPDGSF